MQLESKFTAMLELNRKKNGGEIYYTQVYQVLLMNLKALLLIEEL